MTRHHINSHRYGHSPGSHASLMPLPASSPISPRRLGEGQVRLIHHALVRRIELAGR